MAPSVYNFINPNGAKTRMILAIDKSKTDKSSKAHFTKRQESCEMLVRDGLSTWVWPTGHLGSLGTSEPYYGKAATSNYGVVVKVKPKYSDHRVSVVKYNSIHYDQVSAIGQFREVCILKRLNHTNIGNLIAAYAHDEADVEKFGVFYLVMDYDGKRLQELLNSVKVPSFDFTVEVAMQTLLGMAYIHSHGIPHGELNAESIIITNRKAKDSSKDNEKHTMIVKIVGFGKYPNIPQDFTEDANKTTTAYQAPELITRWYVFKTFPDARAIDLWSYGMILIQMLTGSLPTLQSNDLKVIETILELVKFPPQEFIDMMDGISKKFFQGFASEGRCYEELKKNIRHKYQPQHSQKTHSAPTQRRQSTKFTHADQEQIISYFVDFICNKCLTIDPRQRVTARKALDEPPFQFYLQLRHSKQASQTKIPKNPTPNRDSGFPLQSTQKRSTGEFNFENYDDKPNPINFYGVEVTSRMRADHNTVLDRWRLRMRHLILEEDEYAMNDAFMPVLPEVGIDDFDSMMMMSDSMSD